MSQRISQWSAWLGGHKALVRQYLLWGLVGLLLRLLLMPFAMHTTPEFTGDIASMNFTAHYLVHPSPETDPGLATYPPLAYYTMAFFQDLLTALTPSLLTFLTLPAAAGRASDAMMNWVSHPTVFRYLFFLRSWYLPFDFGTALVLALLAGRSKGLRAFNFWILNPIVIYDGYVHGQFDTVVAFFTLLAIWLASKRRPSWCLFLLAVAAGYKAFPVLFIVPAALVLGQSTRQRLELCAIGISTVVLMFLPLASAYTAPNLSSRLMDALALFPLRYEPQSGQVVYVFVALYGMLAWHALYSRSPLPPFARLWKYVFVILALYYAQAVFDLHYLVWIMPMAALQFVEDRQVWLPYVVIIGCIALLYLTVSPGAFFLPANPEFFHRLPSPADMLPPYIPLTTIIAVARSILAGTFLWLAYHVFRQIESIPHYPSLTAIVPRHPGFD